MPTSDDDARLIRLAEPDNVLVVSTPLGAGERLRVGGELVTLAASLSLGHKLAARPIARGETVVKYDFPIGVATEDIPRGAHVHVHNVRSSYTPTYTIPED